MLVKNKIYIDMQDAAIINLNNRLNEKKDLNSDITERMNSINTILEDKIIRMKKTPNINQRLFFNPS